MFHQHCGAVWVNRFVCFSPFALSIPLVVSSMMRTIRHIRWMILQLSWLLFNPTLAFSVPAGLTMIGYFIEDKPSRSIKVNGWTLAFITIYRSHGWISLFWNNGVLCCCTVIQRIVVVWACIGTSVIFANEQKGLLSHLQQNFANAAISVVASIILSLSIGAWNDWNIVVNWLFGLFYGLIIHVGCYLC